MLSALDRLRILPLVVEARARAPIALPAFSGSTLRGAFGRALKDAVCVTSHRECDACRVADDCAFPAIFEHAVAHPYGIHPPAATAGFAPGDRFSFDVTLIGRATEWMPAVVDAAARMGERGLGVSRGAFDVTRVTAAAPAGAPLVIAEGEPLAFVRTARAATFAPSAFLPMVEAARSPRFAIELVTPARLVEDGAVVESPSFASIIRALLRRAATLLREHEGVPLDLTAADRAALRACAARVSTVASDLERVDQVRFSARQHRTMNLFGVRGTIAFEVEGGDAAPLLPLLALGAAIGVGKGTTFGLGRMRVTGAAQ